MKRFGVLVLWGLAASGSSTGSTQDFPAGVEGELYFAPRIDLAAGGPLVVELDGILDDAAWDRAAFHKWSNVADDPRDFLPPEEDTDFIWAAVADRNFLYVAWKVVDDSLIANEIVNPCDVWQDDSVEVYIDALNNGPDCSAGVASCYEVDDVQITVGFDQFGKLEPEQLQVGGVSVAGDCDFDDSGPAPGVVTGVVQELQQGDVDIPFGEGSTGWQAEIAIALETIGNNGDGTPLWTIDPAHGTCMGFNVQANDDDDQPTPGSDRDHKLIWSKLETVEASWRNPGAFAKLQFIDPTLPLPTACGLPVRDLTCTREEDGSVEVKWTNPATADAAIRTEVQVDGTTVVMVSGVAIMATLTEAQVPSDGEDHTITVINNSRIPIACLVIGSAFEACGGIRRWNILGGYRNDPSPIQANPGEDLIRLDYLTDGAFTETDFEFAPGVTIDTAFGSVDTPSTGIDGGPAGWNPGGVPAVFAWEEADARIDFGQVFGGDLDNVMAYAQTYVINNTGGDLDEVLLGVSSDDSIQVLLNGREVWINNVSRGGSGPCVPLDNVPAPVTLSAGVNSLILKVFEGTGGWEYSFRFQDALGTPITEGLEIVLEPRVTAPIFVRGDADANGQLNITDGIFLLNALFAGGPAPACRDAADADDSGGLNITDGIFLLNWLFSGGTRPPAPTPPGGTYARGDCGPDPTPDGTECTAFAPCSA